MFLLGVVAMACFIFITRALAMARAAVLAPLSYTSIVWATIIGWVVWRDAPTWPMCSATRSSSAAASTSRRATYSGAPQSSPSLWR